MTYFPNNVINHNLLEEARKKFPPGTLVRFKRRPLEFFVVASVSDVVMILRRPWLRFEGTRIIASIDAVEIIEE